MLDRRCVCALALSASSVLADAPPGYSLTKLQTPPAHVFANAAALGETGAAVGGGLHDDFWFSGVSWSPSGAPTPLGRDIGFQTSGFADVNRHGLIAGSGAIDGTATVETPFVYDTVSQQVRHLTPLVNNPQALTQAFGVSDHGWVAGAGRTLNEGPFDAENPFEVALVWDAAGNLTPIVGLGDVSFALDVNSSGVVIGRTSTEFDTFATGFRWDAQGGLRLLPGEGGAADLGVVALDLNDAGVIAGHTSSGPALWFDEEAATPLPLLAGDFFGLAQGINEHNDVVGVGWQDELNLARLWSDGQAHDLTSLLGVAGITIVDAFDINDAGQVLGLALDTRADEPSVYGVILTPIPEPGTAMLFAGLVAALGARRCRPSAARGAARTATN